MTVTRGTRIRALLALGLLSSILVALPAPAATAQTADLLISEIVEGSSNNKAIEIYNGTGADVDLSSYVIEAFNNGSTTVTNSEALSGTLADGDVFVIANASADAAILAVADITSAVTFINGDDALVLSAAGTVVDSYGTVGVDPGSEWPGGGQDETLIRKATVCAGDTNQFDSFDASFEWDSLPIDTFTELGSHTAFCDGPVNFPVDVVCDAAVVTEEGVEATVTITASDPDGTVVDISVNGIAPAPAAGSISITSITPAGGPGGTASATLTVDTFVPAGSYDVTIAASNDDAEAQTDTCTQAVTVLGEGDITPIYDIQGDGADSPLDGQTVVTEGVVTGDFQGDDGLNGFFMQDAVGDGDPATSDGIFVFDGSGDPDVDVGDIVRVAGTVDEFFGLTEITSVTNVEIIGIDSVSPQGAAVPLADAETVEGMLLSFAQPLFATDHFNLHRFGEVVLSANGRQFQPTNVGPPAPGFDDNGNTVADVLEPDRLLLDDGSSVQFPATVPYLRDPGTLRLGDSVTDLTGVLGFGFGSYRLHPTEAVEFDATNPRPEMPDVGGTLQVASFNVLNYWTTIDDGTNNARGADSEAELARQTDKLVTAILDFEAEALALQELENNGPTAIGALVDALNDATAPGTWAFVPDPVYPGGLESTNAIKVGIIYKPGVLTAIGAPLVSTNPVYATDRPPIAQLFEDGNGQRFVLVSSHFKSKSPTDATGADLDQNDGQGAYNFRRTQQAEALIRFGMEIAQTTGERDVLMLGDFNSYAMEDPITTLNARVVNLINTYVPLDEQYSFTFFGMAGLLDYAFASRTMARQVTGAAIWHINADEPRVLDYNDDVIDSGESSSAFNQPLFDPDTVFRSSDHDPVLVGMNLGGRGRPPRGPS